VEEYARETSGNASQRVEMEVDRTYNKERFLCSSRESFQLELHEDNVEGEAREEVQENGRGRSSDLERGPGST
jgi:hypothetical protein